MNRKTKKITIVSSCVLMLLGIFVSPGISNADDISVSGNGTSSNNTVNVTSTEQTTTLQTNNSQVSNTTNTAANTGNNSVSNNAGNTSTVKTGDAATTTVVSNTANSSSVNTGCNCNQNSSVAITGNGDKTANTVAVSSNNNTTVSVNQTASVNNSISQDAITGHNEANNNNGSVTIKTGNIVAETSIKNGPLNIVTVTVPGGKTGSFALKIAGNGADSVNSLEVNENNTTNITITDTSDVINNLKEKYITGGNFANNNNGEVAILTGDVASSTTITNAVNEAVVTIACNCEKEHTKPTPPPAPTPSQPANNSAPFSSSSSSTANGSSGGSSGGTSVMGASANNLPVTGGSYWFFIALIGNILMMLLGAYLRLRSGRSPGFVSAL